MVRHRIDELARILNCTVDGSAHSLLNNFATVTEKEWDVLPQRLGNLRAIGRDAIGAFTDATRQ